MNTIRIHMTGDYEATVYAVARRLLAGGADPGDIVETWRKRRPIDVRRHWRAGEVDGGFLCSRSAPSAAYHFSVRVGKVRWLGIVAALRHDAIRDDAGIPDVAGFPWHGRAYGGRIMAAVADPMAIAARSGLTNCSNIG
jgi:hypothetical protein